MTRGGQREIWPQSDKQRQTTMTTMMTTTNSPGEDAEVLKRLVERMNGRRPRPVRNRRCATITVYRNPRDVAKRWLKRFLGACWYVGGSHVARPCFGPGIAFVGWRNDRKTAIKARAINLPVGAVRAAKLVTGGVVLPIALERLSVLAAHKRFLPQLAHVLSRRMVRAKQQLGVSNYMALVPHAGGAE
jgi:hypothetical protein